MRATTACLLSLITLSLAACGDAPKEGRKGLRARREHKDLKVKSDRRGLKELPARKVR